MDIHFSKTLKQKCKDVHHWLSLWGNNMLLLSPFLDIYMNLNKIYRKSKLKSMWYSSVLLNSLDTGNWNSRFGYEIVLLSITVKSKARENCYFLEVARNNTLSLKFYLSTVVFTFFLFKTCIFLYCIFSLDISLEHFFFLCLVAVYGSSYVNGIIHYPLNSSWRHLFKFIRRSSFLCWQHERRYSAGQES